MSNQNIKYILIIMMLSNFIIPLYSYSKVGDYRLKRIHSMKIQQALLIDKGIKNGRLTVNEAHILLSEKKKIRKTEIKFRKDNHLSSYEISVLIKLLTKAIINIKHETNDNERRPIRSYHGKMHH